MSGGGLEKNDEWYTLSRYVEAARKVMGSIDLDPASCEEANKVVRATHYYTKEENGLVRDWIAESVWLNPPFSRNNPTARLGGGKSKLIAFVSKLLQECEAGHIGQAILLCTASTSAVWFRPLWQYPICFADHRVLFNRPDMPKQGQFFGTCFVYLGPDEQKFTAIFEQFGPVARRISQPKPTIQPALWGLLDAEKKSEQQTQASA